MKACFQIAECSLFYAKILLSGLRSKGETINIRMVFPIRVRIFRTGSFLCMNKAGNCSSVSTIPRFPYTPCNGVKTKGVSLLPYKLQCRSMIKYFTCTKWS